MLRNSATVTQVVKGIKKLWNLTGLWSRHRTHTHWLQMCWQRWCFMAVDLWVPLSWFFVYQLFGLFAEVKNRSASSCRMEV